MSSVTAAMARLGTLLVSEHLKKRSIVPSFKCSNFLTLYLFGWNNDLCTPQTNSLPFTTLTSNTYLMPFEASTR